MPRASTRAAADARQLDGSRSVGRVIVVNRFRGEDLREGLEHALAVLAERPGYLSGTIGRNVDEPTLWLLATTWENVGSYRRALSSYDVKVAAVPMLSQAIDEPSAYETLDAGELNEAVPRELR
jgi:hypothetical protein